MKIFLIALSLLLLNGSEISMRIDKPLTVDSLGACQGVSYQNGKIFLYGDREIGMIREFKIDHDSLQYTGKEIRLTENGKDVINHPTGIAYHEKDPVFIGNSIRMNEEGTLWKAVIYCVDWKGLQQSGTLDGNIINTIEDDACIQGTRPEYLQYKGKWYVATADYGPKSNQVRLLDPLLLAKAKKTSDAGVVVKKFNCSPWVQNLAFIADKKMLVLIQNQVEGRQWRFTYVDLEKSFATGEQQLIKTIDVSDRPDELEGFCFLNDLKKGVAVSSSRKNNVNMMTIEW